MAAVTDQMNRRVELPSRIGKVVSLVPSQTELLFGLGAGGRVAGRTHFCIHPAEAVAHVRKVGGTKRFRFDVIDEIAPDLILGNKEENYREGIERLARDYPVWMSDIQTLEDALEMIRSVGALLYCHRKAAQMTDGIQGRFAALPALGEHLPVAYLIWRKPWMAAGAPTFIDEMLKRCGLRNVFTARDGRYPELQPQDLEQRGTKLVLLSSEPFPFKEKHAEEVRAAAPSAATRLVDGELFSWYGSRLLQSASYFEKLLRDIRHPLSNP